MLAAMGRAFIPFIVVFLAGLVAGAHVPGGPLGVVMLLLAAEGVAFCAAGWAIGLAYRLGTIQRAAPLMQVGMFTALFLSTSQVPLSVMTGWLHAVARVNPMTNVLALARQGFVGHVNWADTWPGLIALAGGAVLTAAFAVRGLRRVTP
jgi:ABC-2 type transport system permease protein